MTKSVTKPPNHEATQSALERDPFAFLGPHPDRDGVVVRTLHPAAVTVDIQTADGRQTPMSRVGDGLYEARLPLTPSIDVPDYRLVITYPGNHVLEVDDPYRYGRVLTDFDLHLLGEGTHHRAYQKLGAHRLSIGTTVGVHFAVWAPNADRVSLVGDFNGWDGRVNPMRLLAPAGIWEIFIPNLHDGENYKFEIRTKTGDVLKKSDPFAFYFEVPPQSASVVRDISRYEWKDHAWMTARREKGEWLGRPMAIYEAHLGSWARIVEEGNRFLTYRELAHRLVPYVKDLGFTHLELLPVMEHPFSGSWGYQVLGFFAPRAGTARPRISSTSSTSATRRGSRSFSTGCRDTSRKTSTASRAST